MNLEMTLVAIYVLFAIGSMSLLQVAVYLHTRGRYKDQAEVRKQFKEVYMAVTFDKAGSASRLFQEMCILAILVFSALYFNLVWLAGVMIAGFVVSLLVMTNQVRQLKRAGL